MVMAEMDVPRTIHWRCRVCGYTRETLMAHVQDVTELHTFKHVLCDADAVRRHGGEIIEYVGE